MREQFMNWPKSQVHGGVSLELFLTERTHKHPECLGLLSFACAGAGLRGMDKCRAGAQT